MDVNNLIFFAKVVHFHIKPSREMDFFAEICRKIGFRR